MKFTYKIKKGRTFKYIFKKGNFYSGKYIITHVCKTKYSSENNFFGVCVSKKNGNSVRRNKLKRWVREVYKNEELRLKKGYNIVFLYKKTTNFLDVDYYKVKYDIIKSLEALDLYE